MGPAFMDVLNVWRNRAFLSSMSMDGITDEEWQRPPTHIIKVTVHDTCS